MTAAVGDRFANVLGASRGAEEPGDTPDPRDLMPPGGREAAQSLIDSALAIPANRWNTFNPAEAGTVDHALLNHCYGKLITYGLDSYVDEFITVLREHDTPDSLRMDRVAAVLRAATTALLLAPFITPAEMDNLTAPARRLFPDSPAWQPTYLPFKVKLRPV